MRGLLVQDRELAWSQSRFEDLVQARFNEGLRRNAVVVVELVEGFRASGSS